MAAAGNTDEHHRIVDEDGRGRRGESHRRGRRRLHDQECRNDNDATSMRAMLEGEQREREEERDEERRAMWRRRQRGCDGGDGAEPEQARRGRCDNDVAGEVEKEKRSGYLRAHVDDRHRRGKRRGAMAARRLINRKIPTLLNNTIFLAPLSRIRPSQA